jgi:hypothetical protein
MLQRQVPCAPLDRNKAQSSSSPVRRRCRHQNRSAIEVRNFMVLVIGSASFADVMSM